VEKARVETEPRSDLEAGEGAAGGPVAELIRTLEEIAADPFELEALAGALGDLERKLPRELREAEGGPALTDPGWVGRLLAQVRPMLIRRLVREERSS
jgi:transcriptional regulator GlxA family with amidase domain